MPQVRKTIQIVDKEKVRFIQINHGVTLGLTANVGTLVSHDVKKRTKPSTFKSKALGSEISKIKYFFKDEKYEYLYYSVFNKAMGTGDLVIEDIIFPRINMNATGKNSGYNKLVIDYLSSTQKSANAN